MDHPKNKCQSNHTLKGVVAHYFFDILKNLFPDKKPNDFNFDKFVRFVAGNRKLVRTYYYNAPLDREKDEDSYMKQQKFFDQKNNGAPPLKSGGL